MYAQSSQQLKKADGLYEQFAYKDAIPLYEAYLKEDKKHPEALKNLADCYRLTSNTRKSAYWYKKAIRYNPEDQELKLYYAQALMSNKKYDQAADWFEKFTELAPYDSRGWHFLESCQNIQELLKDSSMYIVQKMSVNSKDSDFGPAFYKDGLVFTSGRSSKMIDRKSQWTGESYTTLFFSSKHGYKWTEPTELAGKSKVPYHEGPACFNARGTKIYFTRNVEKSKSKKTGTVNLKIFEASWTGLKWDYEKELPFNSDLYSCGHPALSADGKRLYFASDQPGGFGGKDIYVAEFVGGKWMKPKNLGKSINTEGDEMFPTTHSDGTLYFASNGWGGFGGLDLFAALDLYDYGDWEVTNVGYPINSPKDDFGLIFTPDKRTGYFASNRKGSDDLFMLSVNEQKAIELIAVKPVQPKEQKTQASTTKRKVPAKTVNNPTPTKRPTNRPSTTTASRNTSNNRSTSSTSGSTNFGKSNRPISPSQNSSATKKTTSSSSSSKPTNPKPSNFDDEELEAFNSPPPPGYKKLPKPRTMEQPLPPGVKKKEAVNNAKPTSSKSNEPKANTGSKTSSATKPKSSTKNKSKKETNKVTITDRNGKTYALEEDKKYTPTPGAGDNLSDVHRIIQYPYEKEQPVRKPSPKPGSSKRTVTPTPQPVTPAPQTPRPVTPTPKPKPPVQTSNTSRTTSNTSSSTTSGTGENRIYRGNISADPTPKPKPAPNPNINEPSSVRANDNSSFILIGIILDKYTKKPIPRRKVQLEDALNQSTQQFMSNQNGNFYFTLLPNRKYNVYSIDQTGNVEDTKTLFTSGNAAEVMHAILEGNNGGGGSTIASPSSSSSSSDQYVRVISTPKPNGTSSSRVVENTSSNTSYQPSTTSTTQPQPKRTPNMYFKIQVGAFNVPVAINDTYFSKIGGEVEEEKMQNGLTRYVTGNFKNYQDAVAYNAFLKQRGYNNAFVAAYLDGFRVEMTEDQLDALYGN